MSAIKTHYRTCNICEAMCGLEIEYRDKQILSIKGDKNDPLSRGHICPKAVALQDFYYDKDRLKTPLKRTENGWEDIGWEQALDEVAANIKAIQEKYGKNALGTYLGNPNAHNLGNILNFPMFFKALGTRNRYSSASADQLPHHVAANYMFGHGMLIPIPDIDRTDYLLIIGGNPLVSNGSMMTAPDYAKRLKAIQKRGGKVVVIDPRRTETAKKADEHIFIRPERDALLLLGMVHTLFAERLVNTRHLEPVLVELEELEQAAKKFSPALVAPIVGVEAATISRLAREMANAPSAVCYSRMGASTQSFGGLCQWLTNVFNILTGNYDRHGGAMFTQPAFDYVQMTSKKNRPDSYGRYQSRVRKLPYYNGEFPVATLADEILTEGEGQIKGMLTIAGNPVLSSPNGKRLEEAFQQLEYMVAIDIYINETSRHADIILPAATGLEIGQYDVVFNAFAVRNTAKYAPPLFEKSENQRYDWEILRAIASRLTGQPDNGITPEMMLDMGLKASSYGKDGMSLKYLLEHPSGVDLGPLRPCLLERLQTKDEKTHLAPAIFIADIERLEQTFLKKEPSPSFPLQLIGRRLLRHHNTWTHNSYRLIKGKNQCTLLLHPDDAKQGGIEDGQMVELQSSTGKIKIEAELTTDIMPGVVCIPQGWGSRKKTNMSVAAAHPGVSINDLTNEQRVDALTGNAAFNGVNVRVGKVERKPELNSGKLK